MPFLEEFYRAALGTFIPARLHLRLPEPIERYALDADYVDVEAQATVIHETFHFFQTIFTGYGQFAWSANRELTAIAVREWTSITQHHTTRRLPLLHLARRDAVSNARSLRVKDAIDEILGLATGRCKVAPNLRMRELGSGNLQQHWHVCPRVSVDGKHHCLQGKEIIEGYAHYIEGRHLEAAHDIDFDMTFDARRVAHTYRVAWAWFQEQCPGADSDFPVICDLALLINTRTTPPTSEREWQESHPAWRFVALTYALASGKARPGGSLAAIGSWYGDYSGQLLDACGYSPLEDVLQEGLAQNRRATRLEEMMAEALEYRLQTPWCTASPITDNALWKDMLARFPVPVLEVDGELGSPHQDEMIKFEILNELQFQALAVQVIGDLSAEQKSEQSLECGFLKFGISKGCEYQVLHDCPGRFLPKDGWPHLVVDSAGSRSGCRFGVVLSDGFDVRTLEIKDVTP